MKGKALEGYKIQRDPRVWPDPFEFQPNRFLITHKDFDVIGHNFDLAPFGSGRRMCSGISLALQVIGLLSSMLSIFRRRGMRPLRWRNLSGSPISRPHLSKCWSVLGF
ncbi:hypothetical protein CRG98_034139 [Punica granatum]|uniref:Uncharacterized protein n=1 Tax=Punica granatum TaxID=22663 RepID=A0A2I0INA7_PUNGR|nr:hypothetical protein CRG98_034139 [Punica granatum]